jgi:hypothetical protein
VFSRFGRLEWFLVFSRVHVEEARERKREKKEKGKKEEKKKKR